MGRHRPTATTWAVVFGIAVELDGAVVGFAHRSGRRHAWIADQAMRASTSVVLNLAEALGREGADRARMQRIAWITQAKVIQSVLACVEAQPQPP